MMVTIDYINNMIKLNTIKENSPHHQHCQTLLKGDGGLRIAPVQDNNCLSKNCSTMEILQSIQTLRNIKSKHIYPGEQKCARLKYEIRSLPSI